LQPEVVEKVLALREGIPRKDAREVGDDVPSKYKIQVIDFYVSLIWLCISGDAKL
jgi:hypothetical protein